MKGIVIYLGKVLYKYDTITQPELKIGESIIERNDINLIEKGASYDSITNIYINPVIYDELIRQQKLSIVSEIRKKYSIDDEIGLLADVMSGIKLKDNPEITTWRAVVQAAKDKYPKPV